MILLCFRISTAIPVSVNQGDNQKKKKVPAFHLCLESKQEFIQVNLKKTQEM